ncbi:glycosyl transferase family 2 [Algoriphagus aquaeductus]|uniref:Glycosyl transferase family 2 n=1 Tax=Algoriphagus aquaeductus TaxID=475299 RepID=A0A326RUZ4_9BACT|nr:glycosyltransferase [Algoriphagus aquaeductus]PZV76706.1 glycosyl transferase family 2 [Algoriphagus aquaeductus]
MSLVSILVPVFNAEMFVKDSIQSILTQSFKNFELILVDDASSDHSASILKSVSDPRILFFQHETNRGIGEALNSGLAMAKGKYVLRMDADDIAYTDRIARQVDFMENNPHIGVSGTLAEFFDRTPFNKAVKNEFLKPSLLLDCPFVHPTVIIRKDVLDHSGLQFSGYLEDYQLWIKLSEKTEFGLLPEVLLKYRRSESQFTAQNFEKRISEANLLRISFAEIWLRRSLSCFEKRIVSLGISEEMQPDLKMVEMFCKELLASDPWSDKEATLEVVKKLFFRNFYRSPKILKSKLQILNNDLLSIRERLNLLKKSIFY